MFLSSRKYDQGCSSLIRILTFYPFRIPDLGVKKALDPGSRIRNRNTEFKATKKQCCGSGIFIPNPGSGDFYPSRVPDPGSRIPDLGFRISDPGSRIPDLGSRISDPRSWIPDLGSRIPDPKTTTKDRVKNCFFVIPFFVATNFTKLQIILFFMLKKKFRPFSKIIEFFTQKIVTKLSKIWVWDPGSEIRDLKKSIMDPRGQKGTRSRIRIRNSTKKVGQEIFSPSYFVVAVGSGIRDQGSGIRDPGSGMDKSQDLGSGINIPDPQHWVFEKSHQGSVSIIVFRAEVGMDTCK